MNPLFIPTLTALGVYFGAARLASPITSTGGNQNAVAFAVSDSNRQAGARLCAA